MRCECCRSAPGSERRTKITDPAAALWAADNRVRLLETPAAIIVSAVLCDACAASGHTCGACKRCASDEGSAAFVWTCARISHVQDKHPGLIERRDNAPDDPEPTPSGRVIGQIRWPLG
jgi:hypothetical protein